MFKSCGATPFSFDTHVPLPYIALTKTKSYPYPNQIMTLDRSVQNRDQRYNDHLLENDTIIYGWQ